MHVNGMSRRHMRGTGSLLKKDLPTDPHLPTNHPMPQQPFLQFCVFFLQQITDANKFPKFFNQYKNASFFASWVLP
jgi:hypothetical protein